ncbi:MAG: Cysteine-tRNA ligase [Candidatus Gottesmanbacteria bacterium GW2011_GWA1_47_8]|nr:MAG: Cysteine-tRNA ligase [Candidatus Gottesmanbacteria bacterium GW2011_GWA1_47_8]
MLKLYNTLTRSIEDFVPIHPPKVGLYTCGQTVYDYTHIGHGRKYVGDDILRRVLTRLGYEVTHVQNVTDVGHLVSDADEGEDKLEKGAKKTGKTVWEVVEFFTKNFYNSMDLLGILRPTVICKATEHIAEQIALIEKLIRKGVAYDTPEAVYFDVTKFEGYGSLFGQKLEEKNTAVRVAVKTGEHKKHPADFALWFKRVGRFADHQMHWDSQFGDGFPGWHIECSAMAMKYLGETVDIHTGGIEHTAVHHPNEIAQSQAATGKQFVRYWIHHGHLMMDGAKMSKSLGNIVTVQDVVKKGFDPFALRYFYFTAHYKKPMDFTWEALANAQRSLEELRSQISNLKRTALSQEKLAKVDAYKQKFNAAISNDLNMPQALAVVWEVVKSNIPSLDKHDVLMDFDEVLGLDLRREIKQKIVPEYIKERMMKRERLRRETKFAEADQIRREIEEAGYVVEDKKA